MTNVSVSFRANKGNRSKGQCDLSRRLAPMEHEAIVITKRERGSHGNDR